MLQNHLLQTPLTPETDGAIIAAIRHMKVRKLLLDIVCVLLFILGVFSLACCVVGFVKDNLGLDVFISFWIISAIAAIAVSICRLFRVRFKQKKTERIIAVVYLCIAVLTLYPLVIYTGFNTLTFSIYDSRCKMICIITAVLSMDVCVLWMSILSARLLRKYGLPWS